MNLIVNWIDNWIDNCKGYASYIIGKTAEGIQAILPIFLLIGFPYALALFHDAVAMGQPPSKMIILIPFLFCIFGVLGAFKWNLIQESFNKDQEIARLRRDLSAALNALEKLGQNVRANGSV